MSPSDPIGDSIAAAFGGFDVQKARGRYTLVERGGGRPIARLKPFSGTDRIELFPGPSRATGGSPSDP